MRKQYYFRASPRGRLAWDVDRLVRLTRDFPRKHIPLHTIPELDQPWPSAPTWRDVIAHLQLIEAADLTHPIILSASGEIMDGRHRVAKAVLLGLRDIDAVQFGEDPEPDYVGREPDELPY